MSTVFCAATRLLLLYGASIEGPRTWWLLSRPDAVLGISNHALLLVAAVIHLALSVVLTVKRDPMTCGALTGWLGLNYLVYRFGMDWLGKAAPFASIQAVARNLGVAPRNLDAAWQWITLFYLMGTCVILAGAWRHWRRAKSNDFLEHWREYRETPALRAGAVRPEKPRPGERVATESRIAGSDLVELINTSVKGAFKFTCPNCGQHIRCEAGYADQQVVCPGCNQSVTLRKAETLKMTCYFCQGHVEFPAHAIGQKMKCPQKNGCQMDITLKEPA